MLFTQHIPFDKNTVQDILPAKFGEYFLKVLIILEYMGLINEAEKMFL